MRRLRRSTSTASVRLSGRPDFDRGYQSWIGYDEAFDEWGFPVQDPTVVGQLAGLHFVGAHFQRKRKSALFLGVGEDAGVVVERIAEGLSV